MVHVPEIQAYKRNHGSFKTKQRFWYEALCTWYRGTAQAQEQLGGKNSRFPIADMDNLPWRESICNFASHRQHAQDLTEMNFRREPLYQVRCNKWQQCSTMIHKLMFTWSERSSDSRTSGVHTFGAKALLDKYEWMFLIFWGNFQVSHVSCSSQQTSSAQRGILKLTGICATTGSRPIAKLKSSNSKCEGEPKRQFAY